ncbi:MAG: SDR family NAD(P)-dependent oxidoreductase [Planctomycetales bacterium]|nr:SDR family NAD(P)-dependent oxidoreductase [Planctomycetales bacterium]
MSNRNPLDSSLENLSRERLAVLVKSLQESLREQERDKTEPIAIVGAACRFPGAPNLDAYWELLREGRDAVSTIPEERWDVDANFDPNPETPGKMYTKSGGFIEDPTQFDPSFFGISRREAISMDPQQRLLLEIAWETLENAGAPACRLRESNTGVFVGISTNDHLQLGCIHKEREQIDAYYGTGSAASIAAGRIAYALGLQGPTMAIDTACSSSLVALHLACNAIRNRECESALVGGVNLMLSPDSTIYFCRVRALSAEGRCKTFSASADGYVRGEGCGFVMLKRLSVAMEDKDNVLALIRGTAVNHDGRTTGLTVPNTNSQVKLLQAALENASLQPDDVSYIEAHGTGTPLGDPIELNALAKVYGARLQRDVPLWIGSAKTNIGHLEAAAGVAGLLKVILSMRHQEIPASLHFDQPNPNFDWQSSKLSVVQSLTPWNASKRVATVSSFGFSGTNAHVVLQAADEIRPIQSEPSQTSKDRSAHVVCLSAKSENAVREFAGACVSRWSQSDALIGDLCHSLNAKREHYAYRRALVARDSTSLLEQLSTISDGQQSVVKASSSALRIGFLFTGQGAQYAGMGLDLYDSSPTFCGALDRCATLWHKQYPSETPLLELMFGRDDNLLQQTRYTQPCLLAFEYALGELWRSWGVHPTLVMGHSIGEISAACHAGLIDLEMALEFAAERGRLMWNLPTGGSMVAVRASADQAETWLRAFPNVSLAADNGPQSVVLSGMESDLKPLLEQLQTHAITYQPLQVSHAFHSKQIEPVMERLAELTATWQYSAPNATFVSNLLGVPVLHDQIPDAYWADHARNCVRFRQGVEAILNADVDVCIEIGPQPTLSGMAMRCENATSIQWLPSMRRQGDGWEQLCKTLAAVYEAGANVDWTSFDRPYTRKFIGYPQYPFQRVALKADVDLKQRLPKPVSESRPAGQRASAGTTSKPDHTNPAPTVYSDRMSPVFELAWEECPLANKSTEIGGNWLIVGQGEIADQLSQRLREQAARVQQLDLATFADTATIADGVKADSELVSQIKARYEGFQGIDGIVFCPSLHCETLQDGLPRALHDLLMVIQAVASSGQELCRRFWVLTRGACSCKADALEMGAATIWGMMRTVGVESRQLHSTCVDFDLKVSAEDAVAGTLKLLMGSERESHIAMRGGKRFVQRLQVVDNAIGLDLIATRTEASIRFDASYLVTGGHGGVGVRVALWLMKQGAGQVHLVSRSQPASELEQRLQQAAAECGSKVAFHAADVGELEEVDRLIASIQSGGPPLDGIFHLAGAHRDAALVNLSWDDFLFTARSKVQGTLHLHQATQELALTHFVVFSSVASVVGSPGQANYAAANAFMDALMEYRQQQGLPGLSLNWGPWDEVGMAAQLSSSKKRRWETMGVSLIRPEQGIALLSELLSAPASQYVVMPVDWSKMLCLFPPGLEPPLLSKFIDPHRRLGESSSQWRELKRKALQLPEKRRPELVARFVESLVRDVMEVPAEEAIDRNSGFADLGMDSLMGVELRNQLQLHLGGEMTLSATVAFNYPNIAALSAYLAREQFQDSASKPRIISQQVVQSGDDDPVAIVGCAMRFPGGIIDLDGYWEVLRAGASAVEEIPPTRWNIDDYFDPDPDRPGYMNTRWAGVMDDLDRFDAAFFGISPREAAKMDPQHRIVLETVWSGLEQACIPPSSLYGTKAAMFLGISGNDYVSRLSRCSPREDIDAYLAAGNAQHIAAGRVSHFFGLHGPSIALDTACSSSLVAVHLANESLRRGESDFAIAGGVNVLLAPEITISLSKAHMMAKDGRCKTFSDEADGYVRSEGCGLVLLKRLSDAQRDGNRVLAVLRGSCVNHDGRCSAVTVPNGDSQQALIRGALHNASLHPDHLGYVETHGTGTSLGDPIEIDALSQVFSERTAEDRLVLGSVKANLGHLESAAGIAGVLKVLAMLRHDQLPPQPPIDRLNSHVDWERAPVQVSRTLQPWPKDPQLSRYAGVSSFSFGGTNAHVVLADAPQGIAVDGQTGDDQESHEHLFVLSAKTADALERRMDGLVESLKDQEPADVAYTLAAGRDHFNHRAAIVASSTGQLKSTLAEYREQGGHSRVSLRSSSASNTTDIGLLLTNLAACAPGQEEHLLRCFPQIASDVDAQLLECQDLFRSAKTAAQARAVKWTVLQTVLAQHALRWFPQAPTLAGIGIGRFAALAASGMLSIREAAELGLQQIVTAERFMETEQQMLTLCGANEGQELWDLGPAASLRRVSVSSLNEIENNARQQGQVFSRLGEEFLDLVDVRDVPSFLAAANSIDWKHAEQAVIDLGTGDIINGVSNAFTSCGLPTSQRTVADLLGGDRGLVLSTATKAWELEHGIPSLVTRGCIQLSPHGLPPLLHWMREAYLAGCEIDWREFLGSSHRWLDLPTYPFARERYWFDETAESGLVHRPAAREQHPFIGTRRRGPTIKETLFENRLAPFSPTLLQDHKIYDMVVVPGAFHLSAVLAAGQQEGQHAIELEEIVFPEALVLQDNADRSYQLCFSTLPPGQIGSQTFRVFSELPGSDRWSLHCEGKRSPSTTDSDSIPKSVDLNALQGRFDGLAIERDWFYNMMSQLGIQLGEQFRWMQTIQRAEGSALARVTAPPTAEHNNSILHPGLIDGCFQILAACVDLKDHQNNAYIPVKVQRMRVFRSFGTSGWLSAKLRPTAADASSFEGDLMLLDDEGTVVAELSGVTVRKAPRSTLAGFAQRQSTDIFYKIGWIERELSSSPEENQLTEALEESAAQRIASATPSTHASQSNLPWLVLSDPAAPQGDLASQLSGLPTIAVERSKGGPASTCVASLLNEFTRLESQCRGFVWTPQLVPAALDSAPEALLSDLRSCYSELLEVVQFLGRQKLPPEFHLVLVTAGGLPVDHRETFEPALQMLSGFSQVIRSEFPQLRCTHVDLEDVSLKSAQNVCEELNSIALGHHDGESVIAFRGQRRWIPRLVRTLARQWDENNSMGSDLDLSTPYRLEPNENGILSALSVARLSRSEPGPGQIEIQVRATGLNFRDVLNALALYPGDPGPLGVECAGIVTALGPGVTGPMVGTRVVALAPGSFSQYVLTSSHLVAEIPEHLSDAEAAAVPVTHLTADAALRQLAKLTPNESVLIHAGTGGVGQAAVDIALRIGATVYATAGSEEKRKLLQEKGVAAVLDSRSTSFAKELLQLRHGVGVDVVLNSLSGKMIDASFQVLSPTGRFVEIGKIGIRSQASVTQSHPGVQYFIYALDDLAAREPKTIGQSLRGLMQEFRERRLTSPRIKTFDMKQAKQAFQFMAQAKHIGKIVVTHPSPADTSEDVQSTAGYLITGGLGGAGLVVARWLAERGAGRIVLTSRRQPSQAVLESLRELQGQCDIRVVSADVTDWDAVQKLGEEFDVSMPLKGVIHAAGVLDDVPLAQLNWDRFVPVLSPKVLGALNLHRLTKDQDLDFFVMFSSIASILGSPGQGNYATANAFLDGLAYYRRAQQLPALSINWGPWKDVGMVAQVNPLVKQQWEKSGLLLLETNQCLDALELLLSSRESQAVVTATDWSRLGQQFALGKEPSLIRDLLSNQRAHAGPSERWLKLVAQIEKAPIPHRLDLLIQFMRDEARSVLNLPAEQEIDPGLPFNEYGFDSLMAVELANRLAAESGTSLPATLLFDHPTLQSLANYILTDVYELLPKEAPAPAPVRRKSVDELTTDLLAEIESMSDDEIQDHLS